MKKLLTIAALFLTGFMLTGCFDSDTDEISLGAFSPETLSVTAGGSVSFEINVDASEAVTKDNITWSVSNAATGADASSFFTVAMGDFNSAFVYATGVLTAKSSCPGGSYTFTLTGKVGSSTSLKEIPLTVKGATIVSAIGVVADQSITAGATSTVTTTVNANATLTIDNIDIVTSHSQGTVAPEVNYSYSGTTLEIDIDATAATAGTYDVTITAPGATETFTVIVKAAATPLTVQTVKLYNPYAGDGYNSAYDFAEDIAVAGVTQNDGYMKYAAADSLVADIAIDNNHDIRASYVKAELTSINGGRFEVVTAAEYSATTTEEGLKALAATKPFTDNEAILFDAGATYIMKLAGNRGYVAFKVTEVADMDTEGSALNTGYLAIEYKHTAM